MIIDAGIVLYNPDLNRLCKTIDSITGQVNSVILVDNHSDNIKQVLELVSRYENVVIIQNDENYGIAKALNQICERAMVGDHKWVLTLDQDSVCEDDFITKLEYSISDNNTKIGIVCPAINYLGWSNSKKNTTEQIVPVKACMTSGSLTNLKAWKSVGGFAENYFIDFVDNEFCMKLKICGYEILRNNSCILEHQLGESGEQKILWMKVRYSKHTPLRCYYMLRNNIYFINSYRNYLDLPKEYCKVIYITIKNILFSDNRRHTCRMIGRAICDYKSKRMGKLNEQGSDVFS